MEFSIVCFKNKKNPGGTLWIVEHSLMSVILLQFKCVTHFKVGISRKMHWFLFLPPSLCVEFTPHKTTHRTVMVSVTQDDSLYVYMSVFVSLTACKAHLASCYLAHIHIKKPRIWCSMVVLAFSFLLTGKNLKSSSCMWCHCEAGLAPEVYGQSLGLESGQWRRLLSSVLV